MVFAKGGAAAKAAGAVEGATAGAGVAAKTAKAAGGGGFLAAVGRVGLAATALEAGYEGLKALDEAGYLQAASDFARRMDKRLGFDPDKLYSRRRDEASQAETAATFFKAWQKITGEAPDRGPASVETRVAKPEQPPVGAWKPAPALPYGVRPNSGGQPLPAPEFARESMRARALSVLPSQAPLKVEPVSVSGTLTGEVHGTAEVRARVDVEASPLLLAKLSYLENGFADLKGSASARVGSTMSGSNAPAKSAIHGGGIGHQ